MDTTDLERLGWFGLILISWIILYMVYVVVIDRLHIEEKEKKVALQKLSLFKEENQLLKTENLKLKQNVQLAEESASKKYIAVISKILPMTLKAKKRRVDEILKSAFPRLTLKFKH